MFLTVPMIMGAASPQLSFSTQTSFPSFVGGDIYWSNFIVSGSTLYSIGGYVNGVVQSDYSYATLDATGTLGALTKSSVNTIANTLLYSYNDYIFAFQGNNGTRNITTIMRYKVNANKTLSQNATLADSLYSAAGSYGGKIFQEDQSNFVIYNRNLSSNSVVAPALYFINASNQPIVSAAISTPFSKGLTRPTGFNDINDEIFIKDGYIYYIVGGAISGVNNIYYSSNTWNTSTKAVGATANWTDWQTLNYQHTSTPRIGKIFKIGSRVFTTPVRYGSNPGVDNFRILELFFSNGQVTCIPYKINSPDSADIVNLSIPSAFLFQWNGYYVGIQNATANQFMIHKAIL